MKETIGHIYTIYDLVYVFYLDDTEGIVENDIASQLTDNSTTLINDIPKNNQSKDDSGENASDNADENAENNTKNNIGDETNTISDEKKNSIIPFYELRATGKSVVVDIVLQSKEDISNEKYYIGMEEMRKKYIQKLITIQKKVQFNA